MYLWAEPGGACIGAGSATELQAALRAGYKLVVCDLDRALAIFCETNPDKARVYRLTGISGVTGHTKRNTLRLVTDGVFIPDLTPRRGRGIPVRWSWRAAYWCAVLATMGRAGVGVSTLAKIAAMLADARPRPATEPAREPVGVLS